MKIGRPQKHEHIRHFGMQMPTHLRQQLVAAATANRRSLSAEAAARLEWSFRDDELREMFRTQFAKTA